MGLEAVTYPNDLVTTNPIPGDPRSEGDDHIRNLKTAIKNAFPGLAGQAFRVQAKSAGYTVVVNDNTSLFNCTAALTLAFTAAATLGNGHMFTVYANGADVLLDPNAAELINGVATLNVPSGSLATIRCDGAAFYATIAVGVVAVSVVSGNVSLTAVDVRKIKTVTAAADITLPDVATLAVGDTIRFKSSTEQKVRLLPQGSDTIDGDTEYLLPSYCNCEVMKTAALTYILSDKPDYEIGMLYPNTIAGNASRRGFVFPDGTAKSRTTYGGLYYASSLTAQVTMTIASPGVVTWTSNKLANNDTIEFSTSGTLPTGVVSGTTYFVRDNGTDGAGKFRLAATAGGTAIITTGTQSGTHTALHVPFGRGDGSTTFNVPDIRGRMAVGRDALGGTAASRVTSAASAINGDTTGASGGAETVTLTTAQLASHAHNISSVAYSSGVPGTSGSNSQAEANGAFTTNVAGGGTAHSNMSPIQVFPWVVKT